MPVTCRAELLRQTNPQQMAPPHLLLRLLTHWRGAPGFDCMHHQVGVIAVSQRGEKEKGVDGSLHQSGGVGRMTTEKGISISISSSH